MNTSGNSQDGNSISSAIENMNQNIVYSLATSRRLPKLVRYSIGPKRANYSSSHKRKYKLITTVAAKHGHFTYLLSLNEKRAVSVTRLRINIRNWKK